MFRSILALIIGHLTILKHAFKKPVTLEYPEVRPELNDKFRGKHIYTAEKCTGCGICKNVCPVDAIILEKEKDENNKQKVVTYKIDYEKCIFCGNCVFYCSTNALTMGKEFELATLNKSDLMVDFTQEGGRKNDW